MQWHIRKVLRVRGCADRDVIGLLEKRARDVRSSGEFSKLPDEGENPCPRSHLTLSNLFGNSLLPFCPKGRSITRWDAIVVGSHHRVVFEKLVQILVFGCAYHRIADESCSATTLRERRDEWIEAGVIDQLREAVLEAYDRYIGLQLSEIAVDCCITKAPCGGEKAGRSPVDRAKQGIKRSTAVDAEGIPLGGVSAPANRHDSPLLAPTLERTLPSW